MIDIKYTLRNHGWADCEIISENAKINISASYLSDALGGLLSAVVELINGKREARTQFDEEPGEYRWIFNQTKENLIDLKIIEFPELRGNKPNEDGKELLKTECTLKELATTLFNSADAILKKFGEDGYKKNWIEHDFPINQYKFISNWLYSDNSPLEKS